MLQLMNVTAGGADTDSYIGVVICCPVPAALSGDPDPRSIRGPRPDPERSPSGGGPAPKRAAVRAAMSCNEVFASALTRSHEGLAATH